MYRMKAISTRLTFEIHLNDSLTLRAYIHTHPYTRLFNFVTLTRNSEVIRAKYSPNENQIYQLDISFSIFWW